MTHKKNPPRPRHARRQQHPLRLPFWFAAIIAVLFVAVACTSPTEPTSAETTQPEAPTAETVEPAPKPTKTKPPKLTIEQAGDKYLELVASSNAAALEAEGLVNAGKFKEACETLAEPFRAQLKEFDKVRWPGDVERVVNKQFIPLATAEADAYESCGKAADDRGAENIWWGDAYDASKQRGYASSAIRTLLNLPQVS